MFEGIVFEDSLCVFPDGFLYVLDQIKGYIDAHTDELVEVVTKIVIVNFLD